MTNATLATSAILTNGKQPLRIGRVFKNTFRQFSRYFWLVLLEIVVMAIALCSIFILLKYLSHGNMADTRYIFPKVLVEKISAAFFSAIIITLTLQNLNEHRLEIGGVIRSVGKRYFPLLAISLLMPLFKAIAIITGMALLVVPGVILNLIWFVAGAACVGEQLGLIESLKRSQALTKGYRWQLFAIFVVVVACDIAISRAIVQFMPKFALFSIQNITLNTITLFSTVWIGTTYAFGAMLIATVFHELRTLKESTPMATAISVFE